MVNCVSWRQCHILWCKKVSEASKSLRERRDPHTHTQKEGKSKRKLNPSALLVGRQTHARRHAGGHAGRHARNAQFSSNKAFPDNKPYHPSSWMTHLHISSIKTIISFKKADLVVHNSLMSVCCVLVSCPVLRARTLLDTERGRRRRRRRRRRGLRFASVR
jgi:hypothetical protein